MSAPELDEEQLAYFWRAIFRGDPQTRDAALLRLVGEALRQVLVGLVQEGYTREQINAALARPSTIAVINGHLRRMRLMHDPDPPSTARH